MSLISIGTDYAYLQLPAAFSNKRGPAGLAIAACASGIDGTTLAYLISIARLREHAFRRVRLGVSARATGGWIA
jgi:hypothetical protein